ncbi:asparagine synthase (glutamine-hydrolyzing) [Comamonadaceae bacterium G21597-S1]|nr:asparagine synthase (glutamine-hydrolyzing) [Comamonadaceae bacterium G21597-S1]
MCGIFLVLERGRTVDPVRAEAATARLHHRGPDGRGHDRFDWQVPTVDGPVPVSGFLGHTRLSILDPMARSDQPFRRGRHTLAYNGEIYNFRALRMALARRGATFDTEGDTEVLLRLLAQEGVPGLNQANGMWALCLLDAERHRLTAARDRYGKKPLFYYRDAQTLCMASEIGPLLHYLGRRPGMIAADLDNFLRDGWAFPHADGTTHLQGIQQVRAGCAMELDLRSWNCSEQPYFDLAHHVAHGDRDPGLLPELLRDAVCARLVADRKVGLLLSGGVDSSLILSVLANQGLTEQVTCFTGDAGKSDDARFASACIEQLGLHAVRLPLDYGQAGMDSFLAVCRHQEKPFPFIGNALAMPQLYAHIASHDVPVVLDGTGGDEVFAGYWDRYFRFAAYEALRAGDADWIARVQADNADDPRLRDIIARALHAMAPGHVPLARASGLSRNAEDPADLDAFVHADVRDARERDVLASFRGKLAEALVLDAGKGRLHEWLWQNDRNAMMSGIENRSPLLDWRLAPYIASGYRNGFCGPWNKPLLRGAFPVPLPTQWRRDKQGFRWVYHRFLRNHRDQVLELIAASRVLPQRVDTARLLDAARLDPAYLGSSLLHRMLCIAGLEQTGAIGGIAAAP